MRPRKPLHLKLIKGTAQASRENPDAPAPPPGRPRLPAHLTGDARAAWVNFAGTLEKMGVLTDHDGAALSRLCQCHAEILTLERIIAAAGGPSYQAPALDKAGVAVLDMFGEPVMLPPRMRPELAALADADRRYRGWLNEFGLTPAARGKVNATGAVVSDPTAEFF